MQPEVPNHVCINFSWLLFKRFRHCGGLFQWLSQSSLYKLWTDLPWTHLVRHLANHCETKVSLYVLYGKCEIN